MAASVDIRLKKVNKIYKDGDTVAGFVVVESRGELTHSGMILTMEGTVNLQLSAKSVGMFEAFYNSLKPIQLVNCVLELAKPGKLPSGKTEIPFEMPLRSKADKPLHETFHGVFVAINYTLRVDMKRSLLSKDLQKQLEFFIENKPSLSEMSQAKRLDFLMKPSDLQHVNEVPKFDIRGHLDSTTCDISRPLTGELEIITSDVPIKSIELQLIRIETCGCAEGYAKDATEIQNIQIAEGDPCHGVSIPIYMIFPRLFTCVTLATSTFKIEFEVNVVIVFQHDHLVSESFPIKLVRV